MAKISDRAVFDATGKSRTEWYELIETEEKGQWNHQEIVAFLNKQFDLSFWWQQNLANDYEKFKGRRKTGQTLAAGFQIGVRKTIDVDAQKLWDFLFSPRGIEIWLGPESSFKAQKGASGRTQNAIEYEIRVLSENHIRLSYHPQNWEKTSTLQVRVMQNSKGKSILSFHHEKLMNQEFRNIMRDHWTRISEEIKEHLK